MEIKGHRQDMEPVNRNATPNARKLLQYLSSVGGKGILTGQHTQTVAMEEVHESEGDWFWWGRKGPAVAAKLFRMQYAYFVERYHLDNLLWVWNCPLREGYPGDDVVDILSCDVYAEKGARTDYRREYERLQAVTAAEKPLALAEIGILPDMEQLIKSRVPWCYYMVWSKGFVPTEKFNSHETLQRVYENKYAITYPAGCMLKDY